MSDNDVLLAIEEMESYLEVGPDQIEPDYLADWQARFEQVLATADRGAEWVDIASRAGAVQQKLEALLLRLVSQQSVIRQELMGQVQGQRALSAYKPGQHF